jgi:hypothetical protein
VPAALDRFFDDYTRLYTEGNVKGVVSLCHCPFLAIRKGEAIHMQDAVLLATPDGWQMLSSTNHF